MRKIDGYILWPAYLDSGKSRSQGRRIPKKLAVKAPKLNEIAEAAKKLGLTIKIYPEKAYPRFPYEKSGMVVIKHKKRKTDIIKEIARKIIEKRNKPIERFK